MGEKSRTEYSAINTSAAMICRVLTILAGYLTRVVFTRMLSESYVGINKEPVKLKDAMDLILHNRELQMYTVAAASD